MDENNYIKTTRLKKRYLRKFLPIVLWTVIGFLILRGAGTLIRGTTINLKPFRDEITKEIDNTKRESDGVAFAQNFAYEYFNYDGDEKDYHTRLKQYSNLDFSNTKLSKMDVVYINKVKSDWQTGNLLVVDLKVKVAKPVDMESFVKKYMPTQTPTSIPTKKPVIVATPKPTVKPTVTATPKTTATPKATATKATSSAAVSLLTFNSTENRLIRLNNLVEDKTSKVDALLDGIANKNDDTEDVIYIRVPVLIKGNQYKISGYPTFINCPGEGEEEEDKSNLPGTEVKDEAREEIESLVESFVKGFYSGDKTELSYFMKDKNTEINCLNGEYEVKNISKINITEKQNIYFARVYYQISYQGNIFENGMEFKIVRKDDKLLIEKYNTAIN